MPSPEQYKVYSNLFRHFGTSPFWKMYAEGVRFSQMSRHEATHFLGFLLFKVWGYTPKEACTCGRPVRVMLETKNPAARPGSSDGSAQ
jgi:hypothetical protein